MTLYSFPRTGQVWERLGEDNETTRVVSYSESVGRGAIPEPSAVEGTLFSVPSLPSFICPQFLTLPFPDH